MDFKQYLESLESAALETNETATGRITIKQAQRNKLRKELIHKLYDFLNEQEFNVFELANGVIINVTNENIGDVNIELKLSIKGLDFNLDEELDKFELDQKAKATKGKKD